MIQKNLADTVMNKLKGVECQRCSIPFPTPLGFPQLCKACSTIDADKKRTKKTRNKNYLSEILTDLMEEGVK